MRFGILSSRSGRNAQVIVEAIRGGKIGGDIACLIGNKVDQNFQDYLNSNNIYSLFLDHTKYSNRSAFEFEISNALKDTQIDVVISCSFSRILSADFLSQFPVSINSHPSLLPSFMGRTREGKKPVDAAIEHGVRIVGATVHYIDEMVDHGPIIIQGALPIFRNETREEIIKHVLEIEGRIKIQALSWLSEGRLIKKGRLVSVRDSKMKKQSNVLGDWLFSPALDEGY